MVYWDISCLGSSSGAVCHYEKPKKKVPVQKSLAVQPVYVRLVFRNLSRNTVIIQTLLQLRMS